jgi:hypothetical protein
MLVRGLDSRTNARTSKPDSRNAFAMAEPTKPLAPVTSAKPEALISHTNAFGPRMQASCFAAKTLLEFSGYRFIDLILDRYEFHWLEARCKTATDQSKPPR